MFKQKITPRRRVLLLPLLRCSLLAFSISLYSIVSIPVPAFAQEQYRSPIPRPLKGPVAMLGGAAAPAVCALHYTALPFYTVLQSVSGPGGSQAGLAFLFVPFITAFGTIGGTVRGATALTYGAMDTFTLGQFDASDQYLGTKYGSIGWCMFSEDTRS